MDAPVPPTQPGTSAGTLMVRDTAISPYQPPVQGPFGRAEDPLAGGVDYLRVWHSFRRRWLSSIVVGILLGTTAGVLTWLFLPRGYEAVAWLRIGEKGGILGGGGGMAGEYESYRKTTMQLIKSPFVLTSALRRPGIADLGILKQVEDPITWLQSSLQVVAPLESQVLQIRLRGESAQDVTRLVNAVTSAYLDDVVNKDRADRLGLREILERKHKENQAELRQRRETFQTLARQLGTRDSSEVATQRSLLLDHLGLLRSQAAQAEREITAIDTELVIIEAKQKNEFTVEDTLPEEIVESALARDPEIVSLMQQRNELDQQIAMQEQRSARGSNEPVVRRLRSQRNELSERIDLRRAEVRPMIAAQLSVDSRGNRQNPIIAESPAMLAMRREILARKLEQTSKELKKVEAEVITLGKVDAELDLRRSEIENLQSVTDRIGNQLETTAIDLTMPNRVTLIEEAGVPMGSDTLFRMMMSILAGGAAFAAGGGGIVLFEYLRNRLSSPEEMTQRVGIRVLGTLPKLSRGRRSANEAVVSETMDAIRTLVLQAGRQPPKVILVTSAVEQEGKTTVASRLAASLARSDKRTLLLDGDLRHPNVHLALELELGSGLSEVLRGEISVDEAVQPCAIEGLFAMTAGQCDYAAVTALSRPELGKAFKHLRESFDHIVIDAGPVLAFADALLLGQQSDIAIVTALKDSSSVPAISAAIERLRAVGIRVVGTVINGMKESGPRRLYASPLPS
jgi:capsular exopolysaccharide synthesis family protein